MSRLLQAADAAGAACYGDTDRREMLGFFMAHGFQVIHEEQALTSGLPFWIFLRPAAGR
jgi:hypothetical protein